MSFCCGGLGQLISVALVTIVGYLYIQYRRTYSFWSSRGVKGPTPLPFFGNTHELFFDSYSNVDRRNHKKYGNLYGAYEGSKPVLILSDPKIIKEVFMTNFGTFSDHVEINSPDPLDMKSVLALSGEDWKRVRSALTVAFSTSKLKHISEETKRCKSKLLELCQEYVTQGKDVNVRHLYTLYMLDLIARTFYSLEIDVYKDPNGDFVQSAQNFFQLTAFQFWAEAVMPQWLLNVLGIKVSSGDSNNYLKEVVEYAVKSRLNNKDAKKKDLVQILADAKDDNAEKVGRGLTEVEVTANGIFLIAASYDTTTITLSCLTWLLALNPDKQENLYQEIIGVVGEDLEREVSYDDLVHFTYFEAAINEALRLYATDARGFRRPVQDTVVPLTEIKIPKGTLIYTSFHALHHDPANFPDPEQFCPERFLPENKQNVKPCTFMAFGEGPRKCPGIRLAYIDVKQGLSEIMRRYKFVPSDKTVTTFKQANGRFLIDPSPLIVRLEKRS